MAGGKQTPRQRMMGILYLVLLGLIALDVPDSLLDAFKHISDSLTASKTNVQSGIDQTFNIFEQTKLKEQPERAKAIYDKAKIAKDLADSLNNYVEMVKKAMVDETGGIDDATGDYKGRENLDVSVHMMINEQKYAIELHKRIDATKAGLLALLTDKEREGVDLSLDAPEPPRIAGFEHKTWEEANFGEGIPMAAAMTALIKIQADTKNAENEVVKKILGRMDQAVVTLDQFRAVAVPNTTYVLDGQPYTAQIYLSAYDSKSDPTITIEGSKIPTAAGIGIYTTTASGEGPRNWTGMLSVKSLDGPPKTYPISGSYTAAKPSAVVSPEKMNVLYIGLPNPLAVSAPGMPLDKLHLSMSNGSVSQATPGHFIAKVYNIGTTTVSVSAEISPGKNIPLGPTTFRIKRIPDPKVEFAGKSGGTTSAANIRGQDYIFARLDNFEFDAKFNITHFTLFIIKPRQDVVSLSGSGGTLTSAMHAAMSSVTPGTTLVFKDVVAVGPDNTPRGLDPIVISAN